MSRGNTQTGFWTRRQWVRHALGWTAGAGMLGFEVQGYPRLTEHDRLSVERVGITVPDLPDRLAGYTIAQLSDLHADGCLSDHLLQQVIIQIEEAQPDLIALTGDFITRNHQGLDRLTKWLERLKAREGIFGCLGNHDLWHGRGHLESTLQRTGAKLLVNRGVPLPSGLFVAGVDSAWAGKPDLPKAMAAHKGKAPALLLAHEPDLADAYAQDPRIRIQLSGHSHGGQIRIPRFGAPFLPPYGQKYDAGLFHIRGMQLYTNRGLGTVGIPFRFACPPELTLLTLVPRESRAT